MATRNPRDRMDWEGLGHGRDYYQNHARKLGESTSPQGPQQGTLWGEAPMSGPGSPYEPGIGGGGQPLGGASVRRDGPPRLGSGGGASAVSPTPQAAPWRSEKHEIMR